MKFKITRPDGTIIEGEGTVEDVLRLAQQQYQFTPMPQPVFPWTPTWPNPVNPIITWEITCGASC